MTVPAALKAQDALAYCYRLIVVKRRPFKVSIYIINIFEESVIYFDGFNSLMYTIVSNSILTSLHRKFGSSRNITEKESKNGQYIPLRKPD